MSASLRDRAAMRAAFEWIDRLHEYPREIRAAFVQPEAVIEEAIRHANAGGRLLFPVAPSEAWFALTATGRARRVWADGRCWIQLDADLMGEFLRRAAA